MRRRIDRIGLVKRWRATGLGSLLALAVTVLAVLGMSLLTSMIAPVPDMVVEKQAITATPGLPPGDAAGLFVDSDRPIPVVYEADIRVKRWMDIEQRLIETEINDARPIGSLSPDGKRSSLLEDALSSQLRGRNVLVSVTERAATAIPKSGPATVRLVVTPKGRTAGLVIDSVIRPVLQTPMLGIQLSLGATDTLSTAANAAVGPKPVVSALSAYSGSAGTRVTITGSNFGSLQRDSWVTCSGARASVLSWSDTSVVFTVPAAATRSGYVGIVVGGATSNGLYFIPFAQPVLTSISPVEGAAGTVVTFKGRNFGAQRNRGWVSFAGATGSVISWSDTEIRATVPKSASAGWAGVVANGLSSNGLLFAPYGAPIVTSISSRHFATGDVVEITGRNLGSQGQVIVAGSRFSADSWSTTKVVFTVPAGLRSGYAGITRDGEFTSNGLWVTVAPRLTALSRWWAEPGTPLTISGVGFGLAQGQNRVSFGGTEGQVVSWSNTSVTAIVPDKVGTWYVGVGEPGSISNGLSLRIERQPQIDAVTPRTAKGGDTIVLTGKDFGLARGRVVIGGSQECSVLSWSDTRIEVTVPGGFVSGYAGVVKNGVSSNGVWVTAAP